MLTLQGFNGRSLLAEIALRGDKALFGTVLGTLRTRLPEQQVRHLLFSISDINGATTGYLGLDILMRCSESTSTI